MRITNEIVLNLKRHLSFVFYFYVRIKQLEVVTLPYQSHWVGLSSVCDLSLRVKIVS